MFMRNNAMKTSIPQINKPKNRYSSCNGYLLSNYAPVERYSDAGTLTELGVAKSIIY